MLSHPLWNNWNIKKCCDEIDDSLDMFDGYWIDDGHLMVSMYESDPDLETRFELEKCPSCGAKIVCYQTVVNKDVKINENYKI